MNQTLRRVAVIGGVRIPFCRSNTLYADQSNLDMLTGTAQRAASTSTTSRACTSTRRWAAPW